MAKVHHQKFKTSYCSSHITHCVLLNNLLKNNVNNNNYFQHIAILQNHSSKRPNTCAVYATATWLAGWMAGSLSVTRRYCIKTAKSILKLFRPSDSPIILVSSYPCADTKFQGEPFSGGVKYSWGGENWRFSTEIAVYLGNGAR